MYASSLSSGMPILSSVSHAQLSPAWLLCLHNCILLHSLGGWLSNSLCVVRAFITYVCQLADISPRHQHLWCYFYHGGRKGLLSGHLHENIDQRVRREVGLKLKLSRLAWFRD